jgi:hypothetical protein
MMKRGFSATDGVQCVSLCTHRVLQVPIDSLYFGRAAVTGDSIDYDGNQVQLRVGGSTSFVISAGSNAVTDAAIYFCHTKNHIIGTHFTPGSGSDVGQLVGVSNCTATYKGGVSEAGTTDVAEAPIRLCKHCIWSARSRCSDTDAIKYTCFDHGPAGGGNRWTDWSFRRADGPTGPQGAVSLIGATPHR